MALLRGAREYLFLSLCLHSVHYSALWCVCKDSLLGKRGLSEKAEKMDILRGVKLEVKECHMKLETMARDPFHNGRNPGLQIDVENVVIQSTNAKWEVLPFLPNAGVTRPHELSLTCLSLSPQWDAGGE